MARILVVDDEEVIRDLLRKVLTRQQHEVETVSNGRQCLDLLEKHGTKYFQVVFLDLKMPVMGGEETLDNILQRDRSQPVVIMTGYTSFENWILLNQKNIMGCLIKPFDLRDISTVIHEILGETKHTLSTN